MTRSGADLHEPAACAYGCGGTADWPLDALITWLATGRNRKPTMAQTITKSSKDIVKAAVAAVPAIIGVAWGLNDRP